MMKFLFGVANIFLTLVLVYCLGVLAKLLYYVAIAGWRAF